MAVLKTNFDISRIKIENGDYWLRVSRVSVRTAFQHRLSSSLNKNNAQNRLLRTSFFKYLHEFLLSPCCISSQNVNTHRFALDPIVPTTGRFNDTCAAFCWPSELLLFSYFYFFLRCKNKPGSSFSP